MNPCARLLLLCLAASIVVTACLRTDPMTSSPARMIRLDSSISLAAVDHRIEIRELASGQATGSVTITTPETNRATIASSYNCTSERRNPEGTWTCHISFAPKTDWTAFVRRLDSLGIMNLPEQEVLQGCLDGMPWTLTVRVEGTERRVITARQSCPPTSQARAAFERGIEAVIDDILKAAERR
jgi:hypothetical protein